MRIDSGYREGTRVEAFYDPMIAKLIVHGSNRTDAINKLIESLKEIHITGLKTNRDYLISLLQAPFFAQNLIHTMVLEQESDSILEAYRQSRDKIAPDLLLAAATLITLQPAESNRVSNPSPWEAIGHWRLVPELMLSYQGKKNHVKYELQMGRENMKLLLGKREYEVSLEARDGEFFRIRINENRLHLRATTDHSEINLDLQGHMYTIRRLDFPDERYINRSRKENGQTPDRVLAPLNGRIIKINQRRAM